jgi:peroxiredoxin Q/BCP
MKSHRLRSLCFGMLLGLSLAAGTAQAIDVGQKAPDFALPSSTGKEIKLADFAGKKATVLFFFVGAFTNT